MNFVLGGGDTGKTTMLEAVDLLFSPSTSFAVSETDYWMRDITTSLIIDGVVRLDDGVDINTQSNVAYPWHWDGKEAIVPDHNEETGGNDEVYRVRFTANDQQEALWEIIQPDENTIRFSVGLRRQIGLVSLPTDDRNDKDLRLVFGSALDRHIGDPSLRSRIGKQVASINLQDELSKEAKEALAALDAKFEEKALPSGVSVGLTSSKGVSIGALVGLLAQKNAETQLPISSWGAGTRRLASLEIAAANNMTPSFVTVDEIECGLVSPLVAAAIRVRCPTVDIIELILARELECFPLQPRPFNMGTIGVSVSVLKKALPALHMPALSKGDASRLLRVTYQTINIFAADGVLEVQRLRNPKSRQFLDAVTLDSVHGFERRFVSLGHLSRHNKRASGPFKMHLEAEGICPEDARDGMSRYYQRKMITSCLPRLGFSVPEPTPVDVGSTS